MDEQTKRLVNVDGGTDLAWGWRIRSNVVTWTRDTRCQDLMRIIKWFPVVGVGVAVVVVVGT